MRQRVAGQLGLWPTTPFFPGVWPTAPDRSGADAPQTGRGRLVEVVLAALANVIDRGADVALAVYRLLLGDVAEHLDAEAAVQVAHDPLLPRAPHDLRGQPADRPRLGHDVIGDLIGAADERLARHHLVDHAPGQGLLGGDRLAGQQRVRGALDPEQLLEGVVDAVGGNRAYVVVQVEDGGTLRGERDVAHQHDLGVEPRPVHQPDRRDLQVVDQ